jgi:hypothetical protein
MDRIEDRERNSYQVKRKKIVFIRTFDNDFLKSLKSKSVDFLPPLILFKKLFLACFYFLNFDNSSDSRQ